MITSRSLYSFVAFYIPTRSQRLAIDKLFSSLPQHIYSEFSKLWSGSNRPKGHSIFTALKNETLLEHQATALSYLDSYFTGEGKTLYDSFVECWERNQNKNSSDLTILDYTQITRQPISVLALDKLNQALQSLELMGKDDQSDQLIISHFLAQVLHETGGLVYTKEIASGQAYEKREDLGNNQLGDGKKYKGGGGLQLTGKYNYIEFSKAMNDPEIVRLGVDYLAKNYFWESAVFYWNSRGLSRLALDNNLKAITLRINGGYNGLAQREFYLVKCKKQLEK